LLHGTSPGKKSRKKVTCLFVIFTAKDSLIRRARWRSKRCVMHYSSILMTYNHCRSQVLAPFVHRRAFLRKLNFGCCSSNIAWTSPRCGAQFLYMNPYTALTTTIVVRKSRKLMKCLLAIPVSLSMEKHKYSSFANTGCEKTQFFPLAEIPIRAPSFGVEILSSVFLYTAISAFRLILKHPWNATENEVATFSSGLYESNAIH